MALKRFSFGSHFDNTHQKLVFVWKFCDAISYKLNSEEFRNKRVKVLDKGLH